MDWTVLFIGIITSLLGLLSVYLIWEGASVGNHDWVAKWTQWRKMFFNWRGEP